MPQTLAFTSPLDPGKCATPIALALAEDSVTITLDSGTNRVGKGNVTLVSGVAWLYSDMPGSGRIMRIAANQALTIPLFDNQIIGVKADVEVGTLYAMIVKDGPQ